MENSKSYFEDKQTRDLIDRLWAGDSQQTTITGNISHEAYINFYQRQWHLIAGHNAGQHVALRDRQVLNTFIEHLSTSGHETREEMLVDIRRLAVDVATPEACDNTLNLVLSLLLMLKFGTVNGEAAPRRYLNWTGGSLQVFIEGYFSQQPNLRIDRGRLSKSFNAWSLQEIGGIQLQFTDNLADHLLLVEDDTKVLIFHHATFLKWPR